MPPPVTSPRDLVSTAMAGGLHTLLQAARTAGLLERLRSDGPFTLFAPTDDAFSRLPSGRMAQLLQPDHARYLADLLTYHLVPGRVTVRDVSSRDLLETLLGTPLAVFSLVTAVQVNHAMVTRGDIPASNGVIHVIDAVLMPPADS